MHKDVTKPQPAPGRYFRLAYSNITSHGKGYTLHQVRDGMAFCEIGAMLTRKRYEFGTTIHLYENDPRPLVSLPELTPSDLLVMCTRPPLNDEQPVGPDAAATAAGAARKKDKRRKLVPRNGGELERLYLDQLKRYFTHCDRTVITLSPHAAGLLVPEAAAYKDIQLYEYMRDDVQWYRRGARTRKAALPPPASVGFFIRLPRVPGLACEMLFSFGMSGFTNLLWNRIVRVRHADWFDRYRFVMASLTLAESLPTPRPMTPVFADDPAAVQVQILAREALR